MNLIEKRKAWRAYNPLRIFKVKNRLSNVELAGLLGCSTTWLQELMAGTAEMGEDHLTRLEDANATKIRKEYNEWLKAKPKR